LDETVIVITGDKALRARCKKAGADRRIFSGTLIKRLSWLDDEEPTERMRLAQKFFADLFEKKVVSTMATSTTRSVYHGNVLLVCDRTTVASLASSGEHATVWHVRAGQGDDRGYTEIVSAAKCHTVSDEIGIDQRIRLAKLRAALKVNTDLGEDFDEVCKTLRTQIRELEAVAPAEPTPWGVYYAEVIETRQTTEAGKVRKYFSVRLSDPQNGAEPRTCLFFAFGRKKPGEKFQTISVRGAAGLDLIYPGPFNEKGQVFICVTGSPVTEHLALADGTPVLCDHVPNEAQMSVELAIYLPAPPDFDMSLVASAGEDEACFPFKALLEEGEGDSGEDEGSGTADES